MNFDAEGKPVPSRVETEHVCEKCGKPMVLREGQRGPFLACTGYPKCRNAKDVDAEGKPVETGRDWRQVREVRHADGGPPGPPRPVPRLHRLSEVPQHRQVPDDLKEKLAELAPPCRPSPAGPDLKTIEVEETCEDCGGPMIVRRGRRGFFLGCAKYPKCKGTKEPGEATLEKITAVVGAGT